MKWLLDSSQKKKDIRLKYIKYHFSARVFFLIYILYFQMVSNIPATRNKSFQYLANEITMKISGIGEQKIISSDDIFSLIKEIYF